MLTCFELTADDGVDPPLAAAFVLFCTGVSAFERVDGNFPVVVLVTGCSNAFSSLLK